MQQFPPQFPQQATSQSGSHSGSPSPFQSSSPFPVVPVKHTPDFISDGQAYEKYLRPSRDLFPGIVEYDVMVLNPFHADGAPPCLHSEDPRSCGTAKLSQKSLKSFLDNVSENYRRNFIRRSDLLTLVEEGVNEADVTPVFVIEYFQKGVIQVAQYIAGKYGLQQHLSGPTQEQLADFSDMDCSPIGQQTRFHSLTAEATRVIVANEEDVVAFKKALEGQTLIMLNFHETSLCRKCAIDLITVYAQGVLFHLFSPMSDHDIVTAFLGEPND